MRIDNAWSREARKGSRAQALETKRLEQQRHLDQQRGEIHPDHVQDALYILANAPKEAPPEPGTVKNLLVPAVPDDTPMRQSGMRLPMRKREVHRD